MKHYKNLSDKNLQERYLQRKRRTDEEYRGFSGGILKYRRGNFKL